MYIIRETTTDTKRWTLCFNENLKTKFGHIEVSITAEKSDEQLKKRLDEFLEEAVKLYDRVVLGNTKTHNEFQKI